MNTYYLEINENDETGVTAVAFVDKPAIELNWKQFNSDFVVEPKKGESQEEFVSRCIGVEVNAGKDQDQAVAICYAKWDAAKFAFESYTDYPEAAKENAKIALRWAEDNGWGECGTDVGKARANQLAKGEPISRDTIARMAAFERHRQNSQKDLGDGCGRLMWLAWGGDEGIEWAQRKLKQIDNSFHGFQTTDKERRIVSGVLMLANTPIYRRDEQNGEYNVIFTPDTIEKIVNKFFKQGNQSSVNGMHNSDFTIDGVYMFESFIIDKSRGIKAPEGFGDIPEGSWFGSFKVENQDIWDSYIKTGVFKGFSVEGMFNQTLTKADNAYSEMFKLIDEILSLAQTNK